MISLYHKVQKIETLQKTIDKDIRAFKRHAGLDCELHCAECCRYEAIEATSIEFLPFAWHAYKLGMLDYWFDELEKGIGSNCIFSRLDNNAWGCKIYPVRGFICRLFGFSATTDKNGRPVFAACRVLKNRQPEAISNAGMYINGGGKVPVMASYYRQLAAIEPSSGTRLVPINEAIKKALETVYFNLHYRESA
jgi:Fe-S-cluster containining protein